MSSNDTKSRTPFGWAAWGYTGLHCMGILMKWLSGAEAGLQGFLPTSSTERGSTTSQSGNLMQESQGGVGAGFVV